MRLGKKLVISFHKRLNKWDEKIYNMLLLKVVTNEKGGAVGDVLTIIC
jgi:hypothetical protein